MPITDNAHAAHGDNDPAPYLQKWGFEATGHTDVFREQSETDQMPEALYVQHDLEIISKIAGKLGETSIGFTSPTGSGKTALREILLREVGGRDRYVMTHIGGGKSKTKRGLMVEMLEAVLQEGYEYDTAAHDQVRDGVPWETSGVVDALSEITRSIRSSAGGRKELVLIVDQIELYDARQLEALQVLIDAGVRLLLMGVPRGEPNVRETNPELHSRVYWLDREIKPFQPGHTAEYISRSLTYASRDSGPYPGPTFSTDDTTADEADDQYASFEAFVEAAALGPFTADAVEAITEQTGGNPRLVKEVCRDALEEAARTWRRTDQEAAAVQIDAALIDEIPVAKQTAAPAEQATG